MGLIKIHLPAPVPIFQWKLERKYFFKSATYQDILNTNDIPISIILEQQTNAYFNRENKVSRQTELRSGEQARCLPSNDSPKMIIGSACETDLTKWLTLLAHTYHQQIKLFARSIKIYERFLKGDFYWKINMLKSKECKNKFITLNDLSPGPM